jgi:hypothetical protein
VPAAEAVAIAVPDVDTLYVIALLAVAVNVSVAHNPVQTEAVFDEKLAVGNWLTVTVTPPAGVAEHDVAGLITLTNE